MSELAGCVAGVCACEVRSGADYGEIEGCVVDLISMSLARQFFMGEVDLHR